MVSRVFKIGVRTLKSCFLCPASVHHKGFVLVEELPEQEHYIFYCQDQGPGKTPGAAKLMGERPRESPSPAHGPPPKAGGHSHTLEPGTTAPGLASHAGHCVLPVQTEL